MDWSRRTFFVAGAAGIAGTAQAAPFPDKRGKRRLFVIFAPSADHDGFKMMRAQTRTARFSLRDLDLVEVTGDDVRVNRKPVSEPTAAELRRIYKMARRGFGVRLVGKDGTVKLARAGPVPMNEVYELIDRMPMRQREMQERSQ